MWCRRLDGRARPWANDQPRRGAGAHPEPFGLRSCATPGTHDVSEDEGGGANDDVQDVVDALRRHDPHVQPELIAKLVGQVAPGPRNRKDLLTYLHEHPDVVTQGGSRMPKVVGELLYAAIAAGVKGVVSPACASCAGPRTLFHNTADGQRICPSCYNRTRRAICSVCGQERHVAGRSPAGGALCGTCRNAGKPLASVPGAAGPCRCGARSMDSNTADGAPVVVRRPNPA